MYQFQQLGGNANVTLSLLSLGPKRNVKCYNEYFILKNIGRVERHITVEFVLRDQLIISLKLTSLLHIHSLL